MLKKTQLIIIKTVYKQHIRIKFNNICKYKKKLPNGIDAKIGVVCGRMYKPFNMISSLLKESD